MKHLTETVAEVLSIPKEIATNIPKLVLIGDRELILEGLQGLLEYESHTVRVSLGKQVLTVKGNALNISYITIGQIHINGQIFSVEFQ